MVELKRIEEMSLNGWPALQTVLYDGWLLRFAEGYTKRSNSVSAIYGHRLDLDAKIAFCEQLYAQRGIPAMFKVTPFVQPAGLDDRLERLGYATVDHSWVKTADLHDLRAPAHNEVVIAEKLTPYWLNAVAAMKGLTEREREATRRLMDAQPLRQAFAVLLAAGMPVACGNVVVEGEWAGLYDVVADADCRGRGYGESLALHLFHWAIRQGCDKGYLLVVQNNAAANRLYEKLGFRHAYEYWYRVQGN